MRYKVTQVHTGTPILVHRRIHDTLNTQSYYSYVNTVVTRGHYCCLSSSPSPVNNVTKIHIYLAHVTVYSITNSFSSHHKINVTNIQIKSVLFITHIKCTSILFTRQSVLSLSMAIVKTKNKRKIYSPK